MIRVTLPATKQPSAATSLLIAIDSFVSYLGSVPYLGTMVTSGQPGRLENTCRPSKRWSRNRNGNAILDMPEMGDGKGRVRQLVVSSNKPEEGSAVAKESLPAIEPADEIPLRWLQFRRKEDQLRIDNPSYDNCNNCGPE
jgi:hypothetical protein